MADISIHAPLRERRRNHYWLLNSDNFNPRSLAGATLHVAINCTQRTELFQSTLPCGSDKHATPSAHTPGNFNPRSLAGATALLFRRSPYIRISIHAPLRERHSSGNIISSTYAKFQSTLPCGSDYPCAVTSYLWQYNFNPRSLAGATLCTPLSRKNV